MRSQYNQLPDAALDPIMAVNATWPQFKKSYPDAVNTTIGVLLDPSTSAPWRPQSVELAREEALVSIDHNRHYGYQTPAGNEKFLNAAEKVIFGREVPGIFRYQSLGGTGALSLAKEAISLLKGGRSSIPLLLDAGWPNHQAIFRDRFAIKTYDHASAGAIGYNHASAMHLVDSLPDNSVLLLQACGYNDDGIDRTKTEWDELISYAADKNHIMILDAAYLGLAEGMEDDTYAIKRAKESGLLSFISVSMSKNMGLYNERLGALFVVNAEEHLGNDQAQNLDQAIKKHVRTTVSNPPLLAAEAGAITLEDDLYFNELEAARRVLVANRETFADSVVDALPGVKDGKGLFTKLLVDGFSEEQQNLLRNEGILALPNSRINIGGIHPNQIERVGAAVCKALKA